VRATTQGPQGSPRAWSDTPFQEGGTSIAVRGGGGLWGDPKQQKGVPMCWALHLVSGEKDGGFAPELGVKGVGERRVKQKSTHKKRKGEMATPNYTQKKKDVAE